MSMSMTTEKRTSVSVIIKLRELDTDARTVFEHEVAPPRDAAEQRARLIEVVAQYKPKAEIRSFFDYAASFVDNEHLVVAYFKEPSEIGKALKLLARQHDQGALFGTSSGEEAA
jgi:hypothetical protein